MGGGIHVVWVASEEIFPGKISAGADPKARRNGKDDWEITGQTSGDSTFAKPQAHDRPAMAKENSGDSGTNGPGTAKRQAQTSVRI